jgi:hypothetical protein
MRKILNNPVNPVYFHFSLLMGVAHCDMNDSRNLPVVIWCSYCSRCVSNAAMTIILKMMTIPSGIILKPFESATLPNLPSKSRATINETHQPAE